FTYSAPTDILSLAERDWFLFRGILLYGGLKKERTLTSGFLKLGGTGSTATKAISRGGFLGEGRREGGWGA
ncbi:MAG: hypothetical protein AAF438_10060, partial [Pseudomonadota bacterium]